MSTTPVTSSTQSAGLTASQAVTGLCVVGGALAAASIGGIGIVGGGIAFGLSSLELGGLGAGGGYLAARKLKRSGLGLRLAAMYHARRQPQPATARERWENSPRTREQRVTDLRRHYEFLRDQEPQDIRDLRTGRF